MASAINSFPVPVSPQINTVALVGATRRTMPSTRWRAALLPTIRGNPEQGSSPSSATSSDAPSPTPKDAVWLIVGASLAQLASAAILDHPPSFAVTPMLTHQGSA